MTLMLPVPNAPPYSSVLISFPLPQLELISHYPVSHFISPLSCWFSPKFSITYGICICSWSLWLLHAVYFHISEDLQLGTNDKIETCGICLSVSGYFIQYNIFEAYPFMGQFHDLIFQQKNEIS